MEIDASTRILFFAPHPDDESLAAGGLLQRAATEGATVQVVFATNGEDNPWPLRVLEKQWKINAGDRHLWGIRRMQEARDALSALGIPNDSAHFLNLPDQRITDVLLQEHSAIIRRIRKVITLAQPTLLVTPALFDLHPDHNAFSLLVRLALASGGFRPTEHLYYAVHTRGYHSDYESAALELSADEKAIKRRAILCHSSQMALSRRRFMGHVKDREPFWRASPPREIDLCHPVRGGRLASSTVTLQVQRQRRAGSFGRCTLYLSFESADFRHAGWTLPLPSASQRAFVRDATTRRFVAPARVEISGRHATIELPTPDLGSLKYVFAKLKEPTLFYDHAGWRELPTPCRNSGAQPPRSTSEVNSLEPQSFDRIEL